MTLVDPNAEFHLGLSLSKALDKAKDLAIYLESVLGPAGYSGPVVVAGGYVRDMALGKPHKDRDVFLDGGCFTGDMHMRNAMGHVAAALGNFVNVSRVVDASYGTWAKDVRWVVSLTDTHPEATRTQFDFVILHREQMMDAGYLPHGILDPATRASFLRAVLRRVDLRLNAIGASASNSDNLPMWKHDVLAKRLVVQHARLAEDPERIMRRLATMTAEGAKYEGWEAYGEDGHGNLAALIATVSLEAPPAA